MGSVEALCDEITLINDSHNILSGNVDEIRMSRGGNRMSFSLANVTADLIPTLDSNAESISVSTLDNGNSRLLVIPAQGIEKREIIRIINSQADIISMEPAIPSMEEIFITTVNQYNLAHNNEK